MGRDADNSVRRQMRRKIEWEPLEFRRLLSGGGRVGGGFVTSPFFITPVTSTIVSPMGSPNQVSSVVSGIGKSTGSVDYTDGRAQSPIDIMDQATSMPSSFRSSPMKKDDAVSPSSAIDPFETASANVEIDYALGMSEAGEEASISLAQAQRSSIGSSGSSASAFGTFASYLSGNEISYASVQLPRFATRAVSGSKGFDAMTPGASSSVRSTVLKIDEIGTAIVRTKASAETGAVGVWSNWGRGTDSTPNPDAGSSPTGLEDDDPIPSARVAGLMERFARFDLNSFDDAIDQLIGDLKMEGSDASGPGTPMDWIPTVVASGVALGVIEGLRRRSRWSGGTARSVDNEALFPVDLSVWNMEER